MLCLSKLCHPGFRITYKHTTYGQRAKQQYIIRYRRFGEVHGKGDASHVESSFENKEMVKQSYFIGYKTLPLIALTAFFLGLVITLQSRPVLAGF
jgi:ABC-type transporter Mla maintaining outer membrane lipid asymmetry permease subunit MlaE